MSETSEPNDDKMLDVSIGTLKRLRIAAGDRQNEAQRDGRQMAATWWDGYLCALRHVYQAQDE